MNGLFNMKRAILLDILLLLRSKRLRFSLLFPLCLIFQFCHQIGEYSSNGFQSNDTFDKIMILIFKINMPVFVMGGPSIILLSLFWGIEANFINKTLTVPIDFKTILKRKYIVACIINFMYFLLMLPVILFGLTFTELVAASLFLLGPISFLSLYCSIFNNNKFDLLGDMFFNRQGASTKQQFISSLSILIWIIVFLLAYFYSENAALWFMSVSGLIFIALNKVWINRIAKYYEQNVLDKIEKLL